MSWATQRIEHLTREVRATVDPAELGDTEVDHYSIPALESHGEPERQPASEIQSHKQLLAGGEVLISRLNPRKARVLTVPPVTVRTALASGEFIVLRPTQVDTRFLEYLLLSETTRQSLDGAVQSVTRSHQRIRPVQLLKMQVTVPTTTVEQRAIADFLDTETARIDTLIASKQRMIDLLRERWRAAREQQLIERPDTRDVPLMHLTNPYRPIVYGIVQAGENVPDGIPYIKTGDLENFEPLQLSRTSTEIDRQYRRARVHPGDLVIAMRASIGALIMIPACLPHANLTQGTARIAPGRGVSRRWLRHVLQSSNIQEQCQNRAVGSTFRTLNIWDLRRLLVPTVSSGAQEELARLLDRSEEQVSATVRTIALQASLLAERRQALITAAVTGELEIPGAAA